MTREEEIRNAVDTIVPILSSNNGRTYEQALIASGFEEGVKWADKNPKSPWISVKDDLPCNHKELIRKNGLDTKRVIVIEDDGYFLDRMVFSNNEWDWAYATIPSHWMPIPKLP